MLASVLLVLFNSFGLSLYLSDSEIPNFMGQGAWDRVLLGSCKLLSWSRKVTPLEPEGLLLS